MAIEPSTGRRVQRTAVALMDVTGHEPGAQDRRPAASQGASNGADPNPAETGEWLESIENILERDGVERANFLSCEGQACEGQPTRAPRPRAPA